ncbi:MAG TPA: hypothetical protein VKE69_13355, partial [Planctomycetota bacterium]|nr:hypothetical protein [Planctomycetota bacterium]
MSDRLDDVLAEYAGAWRAGERPDAEELCRLHPEIADELREALLDFHAFVAEEIGAAREAPPSLPAPPDPRGRVLGE